MSVVAATLANGGINPITGKRIFEEDIVSKCLSLMHGCGMYDYSGEWGFSIGVPAKSGVSGSIFLVVPKVMGICIFSPPLDERGNSVRGIVAAKRLLEEYALHRYDCLKGVVTPFSHKKPVLLSAREQVCGFSIRMLKAIQDDDIQEVQALFQEGNETHFDINHVMDYDFVTPAHLACTLNRAEIIQYLISNDADFIHPKDRWGFTPVGRAKKNGHDSIVSILNNLSFVDEEEQQSFDG